jgi:predicted transcriptional regulator
MELLRAKLLEGPKSVEELQQSGIPRASAYRDLKRMIKLNQVTKLEGRDRRGRQTVLYALTEVALPSSPEMIDELFQRIGSKEPRFRNNAVDDLRVICKDRRIADPQQLNHLVRLAQATPEIGLLEILNFQAILAIKSDDLNMLRVLRGFKDTAEKAVRDRERSGEERYQALRFLQLTMEFDELSEIAMKIISTPNDPALSSAQPTQLASVLQSICISASRLTGFRKRIYDLLLSGDESTSSMAQRILQLSRQPLTQ